NLLSALKSVPPGGSRRERGLVDNFVAIALFGEEELAVVGKIHFARVTSDERVEVRWLRTVLGTKNSTEPLRLLLATAERARHLNHDVGIRQVDGEVPHFRED